MRAALFLAAIALLTAGCATAPPSSTTSSSGSAGGSGGLKYVSHPVLGEILADSKGMVLYVFTNDEPNISKCSGQCAANWPPFFANSTPSAPSEIKSKLSIVERSDGQKMLAYRGRPLYYYIGDKSPGDAKGDGLNAIWFPVRKPPADPTMPWTKGTSSVVADNVTYYQSEKGLYAHPSGTAKTGIVMIHEWWGLNDNMREMAKVLASNGYAVLAVDLFHGHVATTQEDAQTQVGQLNQEEATANMRAAAAYLRDTGKVTDVVSFGWCFGGGQSLQLALSGETLAATVIYYGFVTTDDSKLTPIHWPVQAIFGENDTAIPPATSKGFDKAMTNKSIEHQYLLYPDVGHAFANPTGGSFAPEETADSWARTMAFLKENAPPS